MEMLRKGSTECFTEVDAATNSGKEGIRRILETIEFGTFSGKQRIYLFDESHQLSRDALDALLKPLEDTRGDTGERKLVCIFCTTEPEKMRETIGSRCGPTFAVHTVPTEKTAARLAEICQREDVPFESEALVRVAESVEGHIRDAFKACEMLSMQGGITLANVEYYLGHDLNRLYLSIFEGLQGEISSVMNTLEQLLIRVSPAVIYEKLAKVAMLAYKLGLGISKVPSYWEAGRLRQIGAKYGGTLLDLAEMFSSRPRHPSKDMLRCDLLSVHRRLQSGIQLKYVESSPLASAGEVVLSQPETTRVQVAISAEPQVKSAVPASAAVPSPQVSPSPGEEGALRKPSLLPIPSDQSSNFLTTSGVYNPPWGQSKSRIEAIKRLENGGIVSKDSPVTSAPQSAQSFSQPRAQEVATETASELPANLFCSLVNALSSELSKSGKKQRSQHEEADSQAVLRPPGEGPGEVDGLPC